MKKFEGVLAAMVTPFDALGRVDTDRVKKLVPWLIDQGIDGFYVCGGTGEGFMLSADERKAVLDAVCEANNGEKLVIAHIGQIATEYALDLGVHARSAGADAVSSVAPFYYKFTPDEIKHYYLDLMNGVDMPFFLYNIPAASGVSVTMDLLDELCRCPRMQGLKFTSSDFFQLERIKRAHPDLVLWNGYDEMLLPGLSMGASGGIGSTYNVLCPSIRGVYDAFRAGDSAKALAYQKLTNDMVAVICKYNVLPSVKWLLIHQGMPCGDCRKPFAQVSAEGQEALKIAYASYLHDLAELKKQ